MTDNAEYGHGHRRPGRLLNDEEEGVTRTQSPYKSRTHSPYKSGTPARVHHNPFDDVLEQIDRAAARRDSDELAFEMLHRFYFRRGHEVELRL